MAEHRLRTKADERSHDTNNLMTIVDGSAGFLADRLQLGAYPNVCHTGRKAFDWLRLGEHAALLWLGRA